MVVLPQPLSPTRPRTSPCRRVKLNSFHGVRRRLFGADEVNREIAYLQQNRSGYLSRYFPDGIHPGHSPAFKAIICLLAERWCHSRRGLSTCSRPCPSKVQPSTTQTMPKPGVTSAHQTPALIAPRVKA